MLRQSTGLQTSAGGLKATTGMNLEIRRWKEDGCKDKMWSLPRTGSCACTCPRFGFLSSPYVND